MEKSSLTLVIALVVCLLFGGYLISLGFSGEAFISIYFSYTAIVYTVFSAWEKNRQNAKPRKISHVPAQRNNTELKYKVEEKLAELSKNNRQIIDVKFVFEDQSSEKKEAYIIYH